jgi:hypothetical protein
VSQTNEDFGKGVHRKLFSGKLLHVPMIKEDETITRVRWWPGGLA